MKRANIFSAVGLIALAALARFIPHPPNFVPISAMALFGGACLGSRRSATLVILLAMLISDYFLGFHSTILFVYAGLIGVICIGATIPGDGEFTSGQVVTRSLLASGLFFIVSNFGVFLTQDLYPKTLAGLGECYLAAIPFFQNSVTGDLFYAALLFGLYALSIRAVGRQFA